MSDTPPTHAQPAHARHARPAAVFATCVAVIIGITVFVLSLDAADTRRENPRTENAYVGGDVTRIAARVPGYLTSLPIADNQPVHAGDLLATIEDNDYRAERDRALAALQAARAHLDAIDAQQTELLARIAQTHTAEQGSIAATVSTQPELIRQEILIHTDAGIRRALDAAIADQKRDMAAIEAAHAERRVRELQAATLEAQRKQAAAEIAARQADLDLATLNLGWTHVTAPVDGTLGARRVRVGDLMAAGTPLITLTPLNTVWVDANFTERQISNIRVGQPARLVLDAFPREVLAGRVTGLAPVTGGRLSAVVPDNTTGNYTKVPARVPVRIAIIWSESGQGAQLRGLVRPGMSVVATVMTGSGR